MNFLSIKCPINEMPALLNSLSIKCHIYLLNVFLQATLPWPKEPFFLLHKWILEPSRRIFY